MGPLHAYDPHHAADNAQSTCLCCLERGTAWVHTSQTVGGPTITNQSDLDQWPVITTSRVQW